MKSGNLVEICSKSFGKQPRQLELRKGQQVQALQKLPTLWLVVRMFYSFRFSVSSKSSDRQSAKTADWLVDNDVIWPVLRNCACANPGKLKIDRSMAAERERAMLNYKDLQDCCS